MRIVLYALMTLSFYHIRANHVLKPISLQAKPVLPIPKETLAVLSNAIKSKRECNKFAIIHDIRCTENSIAYSKGLEKISTHSDMRLEFRDSNHLTFKYQQNVYKGLLFLNNALHHWTIGSDDNNYRIHLPEEIIMTILSYFSEHQINNFIYTNAPQFFNYVYDQPVNILLKDQYYLSHNDLFALITTLQLFKHTAQQKYILNYSDHHVALPLSLNPYIEALLSIINDYTFYNSFASYDDYCYGKLLFLYYSGVCLLYNPFPGIF